MLRAISGAPSAKSSLLAPCSAGTGNPTATLNLKRVWHVCFFPQFSILPHPLDAIYFLSYFDSLAVRGDSVLIEVVASMKCCRGIQQHMYYLLSGQVTTGSWSMNTSMRHVVSHPEAACVSSPPFKRTYRGRAPSRLVPPLKPPWQATRHVHPPCNLNKVWRALPELAP